MRNLKVLAAAVAMVATALVVGGSTAPQAEAYGGYCGGPGPSAGTYVIHYGAPITGSTQPWFTFDYSGVGGNNTQYIGSAYCGYY